MGKEERTVANDHSVTSLSDGLPRFNIFWAWAERGSGLGEFGPRSRRYLNSYDLCGTGQENLLKLVNPDRFFFTFHES